MYCDKLIEIALECRKSGDITHLCEVCIGETAGKLEDITNESKRKKVKYLLDAANIYAELPGKNFPVSVDALRPLIREKDPVVIEKVISHIQNALKRETPQGGKYHKKLTAGNVMQIIHQVKAEGPLLKKYHYFLGNKKEKKRGPCCFRARLRGVVVVKKGKPGFTAARSGW